MLIQTEKETYMIFNFGVSSGHHEHLDDLVPVETHCVVQGRIPFLEARNTSSTIRNNPTQVSTGVHRGRCLLCLCS